MKWYLITLEIKKYSTISRKLRGKLYIGDHDACGEYFLSHCTPLPWRVIPASRKTEESLLINSIYTSPYIWNKDENDGKVPAKSLSIVWGRDSRYWKLPKTEEEPAELLQVCWLEVTGSVDTNPKKSYEVGFKLSLTPDAFGWTRAYCPLSVMTKRGKNGNTLWKRTSIDGNKPSIEFEITGKLMKPPQDEKDTKLYFGLYEIWSGKWKGGLKIHHAFVREAK